MTKKESSLEVSRTALFTHLASPTTDIERVAWSEMSWEDGLPEMNVSKSFPFLPFAENGLHSMNVANHAGTSS